ncbi:hypothetical protein U3516DRAFT_913660 [Neocallimastix sp. 'constans']
MRLNFGRIISLLIAIPSALAAVNGKCSSGNGVCVSTTSCSKSGGTYVSNKCPNDPSNIKCCNKKCSYNGKSGQCTFKSQCKGSSYSNLCPGGKDFICCIDDSTSIMSSYGSMSTKFNGTKLSRSQFVTKVKSYCKSYSKSLATAMCNNPGLVYDTAKNNDVNALLVVVRAIIEGNSPGASRNNYWGIGCVNGGGVSACYKYSSLAEGIKGFAKTVNKYSNLAAMTSKYAYIGKYWFNPGSWSNGGCVYFPYIKSYMSASRAKSVTSICAKKTTCTPSGGDCTKTTQKDQDAYANWQVEEKMGPTFKKVFGI